MKPFRTLLGMLVGITLLSACTHYHYGVPEDDWQRMDSEQRAEIIRLYQERRMHEERRRALEAEMRAQEMEASRHHGYPERVHLHFTGGVFIIRGHRYAFHHHDFELSHGETKRVVLVSVEGGGSHRITLYLRYLDGKVMLGDGRRYLRSFDYRDEWQRGEHHTGVSMRGEVLMEGAELVIGTTPYRDRPAGEVEGRHPFPRPAQGNGAAEGAGRGPEGGLLNAGRDRLMQEQQEQRRAEQQRAEEERAAQEAAKREAKDARESERERAREERLERLKEKQKKALQAKSKREKAKEEKSKEEKSKEEKSKEEKSKEEKSQGASKKDKDEQGRDGKGDEAELEGCSEYGQRSPRCVE